MSKILGIVIALGLAVSYVVPVLAADSMPTTRADCKKQHMHWDAATKTCMKSNM
jgi:hypothetical protein